jgi:myo-inositol-1(or 4)-monophosphatase
MLDPILNPWDLLPLIPVIEGAGGRITGWDGGPAQNSAVAAAPGLHESICAYLKG